MKIPEFAKEKEQTLDEEEANSPKQDSERGLLHSNQQFL
jgi:hypothetical protein